MNVSDGNSGQPGRAVQDFDLNLAPIIDCFTVLITFLLASASYLAIGVLDAQLAVEGNAAAQTDKKPPPIRLDIVLNADRSISVTVSGKGKLKKTIPASAGEWNRGELLSEIDGIQKRWPGTQSVVLSAGGDIEYAHLVRIMDAVRPKLPSILLGGL